MSSKKILIFLLLVLLCSAVLQPACSPDNSGVPKMKIAHRIAFPIASDDSNFAELFSLLVENKRAADEICIFTEPFNYACPPLDLYSYNIGVIKKRLNQFRAAGFTSVGINVLNTMGHLDDWDESYPPMTLPPTVGHDGKVSKTCPCPNRPEFREYIQEKYRITALAHPDFIWLDDDVRGVAHGPMYTCFCPFCIDKFDPSIQDRETLVNMLETDLDTRERWVEFQVKNVEELVRFIGDTVREVDPKIKLGLMTTGPGFNFYTRCSYDRWYKALGATKARPGGGLYDDYTPGTMLSKAFDIGRQCTFYPSSVTDVQYELENFPALGLDKSVQSVLNEITLSLATGCNGAAMDALRNGLGPLDNVALLYPAMAKQKPVWDEYVKESEGLPLTGLWGAWSRDAMVKRPLNPDETWFRNPGDYNPGQCDHLAAIGIPMTLTQDESTAVCLPARIADLMSDEELRAILSKGVIIDTMTLEILWKRGFGPLTGVKLGKFYTNGVQEKFTDNPLNGNYKGDTRVVPQAFYPFKTYELEPVADGVEPLSYVLRDEKLRVGVVKEGWCMTAYTNELGGRVVVAGFLPWTRLTTFGKRAQMLAVADWVSYGKLPLIIDKPCRVSAFVRMDPEKRDKATVLLLNTSYDYTGPVEIRLRADVTKVRQLSQTGSTNLRVIRGDGEVKFTIKNLTPWQPVTLVATE